MAINCENLEEILRDCSSAIGGIRPEIYINASENVDFDAATFDTSETHLITTLPLEGTPGVGFEEIQFRRSTGSLEETYSQDNDGAIVFEQTVTFPIHARDVAKSRKITIIASGARMVDLVVTQNDGQRVYIREAVLTEIADGTGTEKTDGSKYTLTFTAQSEHLAYYLDADVSLDAA